MTAFADSTSIARPRDRGTGPAVTPAGTRRTALVDGSRRAPPARSGGSAHAGFANTLAACWLFAAVLGAGAAAAQADTPWKVDGKLLGEPKASDPLDGKKSEDVSGIACAAGSGFPRLCLVVDDEAQGAQIVIVDDGELSAGDVIRLIHDTHEGKLLELDGEGVAYADGFFYVIGSHGRPRHEDGKEARNKAKAEATRRVFRIRFAADVSGPKAGKTTAAEVRSSGELVRFIKAQPALASSFDKPLEDNGLTIEGVAVRDGRLHAGMRGPVPDDGSALILSIPLGALFEGQPGDGTVHRARLGHDASGGRRGIRDLVAFGSGFLIVAGPVNDPPSDEVKHGDYAIFSYDGTAARKLMDLPAYGTKVKPEALLPLEQTGGKLRALVLFDGPDEGAPRPVTIDLD
jgi:hypothetical protein